MLEEFKLKHPVRYKYLFTVTTFSKYLALSMFIIFPIIGFYLGMKYQEQLSSNKLVEAQNSTIYKVTPTLSPNLITQDWQVYINKSYNYTFKVPKDWIIKGESSDNVIFVNSSDIKYFNDTQQLPHLSKGNQLEVVITADNSYTRAEPVESYFVNPGKEILLDGEKGMLWTTDKAYNYQGQMGYELRVFHKGNGYFIYMLSASPQDLLFNQILSTFKFTN